MSIDNVSLTAGMRNNLVALQNTASLVQTTQQALSTGKKVNSALDNPLEYFASQNMLNQANALSSYNDGMSNAIQTIQAANQGITGIESLVQQAQSLAQSAMATTSTATQGTLNAQFATVLTQINNMATDSGFQGTNLLAAAGNTLTVTFGSAAGDTLTVTGKDCSGTTGLAITNGGGGAGKVWTTASADSATCATAMTTLQNLAQSFSSNLSVIQTRQSFSTNMINVFQTGSDNLVLADTNEEGANMLMLQTRQALGTTALSLSSQAAQSVLKLFP